MYKFSIWKSFTAVLLSIILFTACNMSESTKSSNNGFNPSDMDTTVSPGQNFYEYADGGWIKNNPVPASKSSWSSFNILHEHNIDILKGILDSAAASNAPKGSVKRKVGDFYISGMDTTKIDEQGMTPVESVLDEINGIDNKTALLKTLAILRSEGMSSMYSFYVNQDDKDATKMVAYIGQGGLGLPDRDYYVKNDKRSQHIRKAYVTHVAKMFELMGDKQATADKEAQTVMDIEKNLAEHSMTRVERRDPDNTYHKMTLAKLDELTPDINWKNHLQDMGVSNLNEVIVSQPKFMENLNKMLNDVSINKWKTYLRWHVINAASPYLSSNFENEDFNFYGKVLQGTKKMEPRWKRVLSTMNRGIGFALGQLYVEKAFPPEAKQKAMEMINDIKSAFRDRIQQVSWMSDNTKKKALTKLDAFIPKIGYPDKWRDYSKLDITSDSYFKNVQKSRKFAYNRMINKLGKPVDRNEWHMTPQTVNAYYNPNMNEIVFPAGILQPPFFDPNADAALNYGGMGAVIGHEMSHGFDDQGSKYDAHGNLHDWWTQKDREQFNKRARSLVGEYDNFVVLDSLHINGKLTLGENIADNGGLSIAYAALQKYFKKHGEPGKIQGFTPSQRFFLAWARIWKSNYTPENLENRLRVDPHSPGKFRTNGVVRNIPAFYKAFNIQKGDNMYTPPDKRANVWAAN